MRAFELDESMTLKFGLLVSSSNAFKDEGNGSGTEVHVQTDQPLIFTIEIPSISL